MMIYALIEILMTISTLLFLKGCYFYIEKFIFTNITKYWNHLLINILTQCLSNAFGVTLAANPERATTA